MEKEIGIFFKDYEFSQLGVSIKQKKEINKKNFITLINEDIYISLNQISALKNNFKSHSFRAVYITRLLRKTNLEKVTEIIGQIFFLLNVIIPRP